MHHSCMTASCLGKLVPREVMLSRRNYGALSMDKTNDHRRSSQESGDLVKDLVRFVLFQFSLDLVTGTAVLMMSL